LIVLLFVVSLRSLHREDGIIPYLKHGKFELVFVSENLGIKMVLGHMHQR